jgi:DNA polymerase-1
MQPKFLDCNCSKCKFKKGTFVPPQKGARLMFIGEAPGGLEEKTGIPFVGETGEFLRNSLSSIGIDHTKVYITNTCMCRPENNKTPTPKQASNCADGHIWEEIQALQPELVILVGNVAIQYCLDISGPSKYRGVISKRNGTHFLGIYHPSYIKRNGYNQKIKRIWYNDLNKISRFLSQKTEKQYILIEREAELDNIVNFLNSQKVLAFDIETTPFEEKENMYLQDLEILTIAFSWAKDKAVCIPLNHPENKMNRAKCEEAVRNILLSNSKKIIHNVMFEDKFLKKNLGIETKNIYADTMLMQYVINPEEKRGLKYLSWKYLPCGVVDFVSDDYKNEPLEDVAMYNMDDADKTLQLYHVLKSKLLDDKMRWLNYKLMPKLATTLVNVESRGCLVDQEYLAEYKKEYEKKIQQLKTDLFSLPGVPNNFNDKSLNSPQQLRHLLFEIYKLSPVNTTDKGALSTDKETLEELAGQSEFCKLLLEYRKYSKIYSTYVKGLQDKLYNGRVYGNLRPATVTGRLKSDHINLQNPPKDSAFRKVIIAPVGWKLISFDFKQLEIAVLAMYCKDETLIELIKNGADIHSSTASYIFEKPIEEITDKERFIAKNGCTFPVIYGESENTTARRLGLSLDKFLEMRDKFFEMMPGVLQWKKKHISQARTNGYVRSYFGRIRYLDYANVTSEFEVFQLDRYAVNSPIQSLAGDINNYAMVLLENFIKENGLRSRIILPIHDELVLECPDDEIDIMVKNGKRIMEGLNFDFINVPLRVDIAIGNNFGEL